MSSKYEYEIGLDLHKKFSVLAVNKSGTCIETIKLPNDRLVFDTYFSNFKKHTYRVTFESSSAYYWLVDYFNDNKIPFIMSNPFLNRAIANVRTKNDKYDAQTLAELTRADLIARCFVPEQSIRHLRSLVFYRSKLIAMRTRLKNMVHTMLAKYNYQAPYQDIFGTLGRRWIASCTLPDVFRTLLSDTLDILDDLDQRLAPYRKMLYHRIKDHPYYRILKTVSGIDVINAAVLIARIGTIDRFKNVDKFVRYAGFAVNTRASAGVLHAGHINKKSDRYIRTALVEASWLTIRKDAALAAFYEHVKAQKGSGCAIVAVGRKLSRSIYFMLKNNRPYKERRMQPQWLPVESGTAAGSVWR